MKLRLAALGLLMSFAASAFAADAALAVRDAWIRPAPPNVPVLAGYMILENHSTAARSLVGASSQAFGKITIHRSEYAKGVAKMTHVAAIEIAARGKTLFEPGAYHLMLEQPKRSLNPGDSVPIVLRFSDGSRLPATFQVRTLDAMYTQDGGHDSAHGSHASGDLHRVHP